MMLTSKRRKSALMNAAGWMAVSSALLAIAPAIAQDDAEVVTVTAQRRSQDLQEVPAAVTALTTRLRDETGIITPQQQLNFTPGVTYNPSADRVTVRGIGRLSTQLGTDPGVAVYQDGFYIGSVAGIGASTLGTERVEVLRGPQGTLYGRNSIGGAVNTISRRPSEELAFDVRTSLNSYGGFTVESRVAGNLFEGVNGSLRIGAVDQDEGYYKNRAGGPDEGGPEQSWNVNAQLEYEGEDLDAWISYSTLESDTRPRNSTGITPYGVPNRGTGVPYVFYGLPADGNPGVTDHRAFRTNRSAQASYDDYHQVIGEVVWHGDGFDVKYIGGYRTYDYQVELDGNATDNLDFDFPLDCGLFIGRDGDTDDNLATPPDLNIVEDCDLDTPGVQRSTDFGLSRRIHNDPTQTATDIREEYSHEINITSTGDGPLQYIIGAYFFKGDQQQDFNISSHNEPGNRVVNAPFRDEDGVIIPGLPGASPLLNPDPDESLIYRFKANLETKSTALFGQIDYEFSDELKATVGLRYSYDEKKGHEENIYIYQLVGGLPVSSNGVSIVDTVRLNAAQAAQYGLPVGTVVSRVPVFTFPPGTTPAAGPFFAYPTYDYVGASCPQPGSATLPEGVPDFYRLDPNFACPIGRDLEADYEAVTGTAGLEWTPSEDRMVYIKYSRGYKSGGFANLGSALKNPFVDAETIDAYEAGWKEKVDDSFQFSSSIFFYQYHDQQSPVAEIQGPENQRIAVSVLKNLPEVETYGAELEAQWEPIDNLRLLLNYSYLHTEIIEGCCYSDVADPLALQPGAKPVGAPNISAGYSIGPDGQPYWRERIVDQAQSLVGNELAGSPAHKIAINATYSMDFEQGELIGSVTWNWRDDSYQTLFNNPLHLIEGGDTTDVRLTWIDAESGVSIIGTVTNLFDDELASGFFTDSPARLSFQSLFLEPPRIYTLELRYSF